MIEPSVPTPLDAHRWAARLPRRALSVGAPLVVAAALVVSIATGTTMTDPATLGSLGWALVAVGQGACIAALPLLVALPHRTVLWAAAACTVLVAAPDASASWAVAAVVLALLWLADTTGAARQRVVARSWRGAHPPAGTAGVGVDAVPPHVARAVTAPRAGVRLVVALLAAVAATGALWYVHDARAADTFRADAETSTGTVVRVADDTLSAVVDVGGTEVTVALPSTTPAPGDRVAVRHTADRAELVTDPFDATGALLPTGAGALTAVVLLGHEVARRRAGRRVVAGTSGVLALVAVPVQGDWVDLEPVGAVGSAVTRVRLAALGPAPHDASLLDDEDDLDARWDDEEWEDDEDDLDDDELRGRHAALAAAAEERARAEVAAATDAELFELGARDRAAQAADEVRPTILGAATTVRVHGLEAQGDRVVLDVGGSWFVSNRPARDLRWLPLAWRWGAFTWTPTGRATPSRPRPLDAPPLVSADAATRLGAWVRLAHLTGRWAPWLAVPGVAWVSRSMVDVIGPWHAIGSVTALGLGYGWATFAQYRLRLSPAGVRVRGVVWSELVPWHRLTRVTEDGSMLVLRVTDPADAFLVHAEPRLGPFLRGARTTADAARAVSARAERAAGPRASRSPRLLPTPGVSVLLAWVGAAVAGGLA